MKLNMIALSLPLIAVSAWAGQTNDTKVDSINYESATEWKIFESGVTSMNTVGSHNGELRTFQDLGGIPASEATCIAVDNAGTVWIGTSSGLVMRAKETFKVFKKESGLSDTAINKILCTKSGTMWVATGNGVSKYQGGAWTAYGTKDGLAGDNVHDLTEGPDGTIWFGTNRGISKFDGATWTTYTMKTGLSWNDTKAITYDARTGIIWAAVGDKDINSFNGKSWRVFMEIGDGIDAIMADTHSRIWIGTASGLIKFNGDEWVSDPQKVGITASNVTQMFHDEKGNLWFGMEKGVLKLNNPYPY